MKSVRLLLPVIIPGALLTHSLSALADTAEERIESLDQKVRILERRLELTDEDAAAKATQNVVSAGGKGVIIRSADGNYELRFRGALQVESRNFLDDSADKLTNTFLIRKARPIFEGTFAKYIDYRLMPDFAGTSPTLFDAYVDLKYVPAATVRVGKYKAPLSLLRLQDDTVAVFFERALVTELTAERDIGVQVGGAVFSNTVNYAVGVFNGVADSASSITDNNDRKDVAGRLFFQPWYNVPGALQGLGFGIAGSTGHQEGRDGIGLKSLGQVNIFTYRAGTTANTTVVANGDHSRLVPQLYFYKDNFGFIAEYAHSSQDVKLGTAAIRLEHTGWDVEASWVVTGENSLYKGVRPATAFAPGKKGWGALELGLRYGKLDIDHKAFPTYADPTTSILAAKTIGMVVNWYLNSNVKIALDYDQTGFTGGAAGGRDRPTEKLIIGRLQLAY